LQQAIQVLRDVAIVALAYIGALAIRFDGEPPAESWRTLAFVFPAIAAAYVIANSLTGIYRTAWQYGGIPDVLNLARAVLLATAGVLAINVFVPERDLPLSVNLVAGLLAFIGMGAAKLWARLSRGSWATRTPGKRLLIVGAGNTGQLIAREFLEHPGWAYQPVAFVDDDPRKQGVRVHGIPVVGTLAELDAVVRDDEIDTVALALPASSGGAIRGVVDRCQELDVQVRMVPGLPDIVQGRARAGELREVTVVDLLSREPVEIDYSLCSQEFRGKSVLITGAAGSIGSELARQMLAFGPLALLLFDNNESALHDLHLQLTAADPESAVRAIVGDITDGVKVEAVFAEARPQIVFHAAAYKHVPLMEEYPEEAFRVNVLGTLEVFDAAAKYGAEKLVFVSSDKAVNPTSVLGVTKRLGELLVLARGEASETVFCAVRFGNVIGSRGSVVPTFWGQIERGGPVSITDPEATRYFLTVPEAVSLVIQAAAFAGQGQIYILDMGDEIRIQQLAEKMIRLRGLRPHEDVPIAYTGLRRGEKLREELVGRGERTVPTMHPKILAAEGPSRRPRIDLRVEIGQIRSARLEPAELAAGLHRLVDTGIYPAVDPTTGAIAEPEG
jgi:FlaA1/EpsC-like NDP-sugar epimerase